MFCKKYFNLRFNAFFFNTYFIYPNAVLVTLRDYEDADITLYSQQINLFIFKYFELRTTLF